MSKKVAILQSNYIPWKGYFDIIASVDEFIIYDEVQFTKEIGVTEIKSRHLKGYSGWLFRYFQKIISPKKSIKLRSMGCHGKRSIGML